MSYDFMVHRTNQIDFVMEKINMTFTRLTIVALLSLFIVWSSALAGETLLQENFNGVALGDSVEEGTKGTGVWSKDGPKGWTVENDFTKKGADDLPAGLGIEEWTGWSFAKLEWWVQTAGNQGRALWKKADGAVAIADPDEWDDEKKDDKSPDDYVKYNSYLRSPSIDLGAVKANSIKLAFDSSFRMEKNQDFELHAAFDGAKPIVLMHLTSDDTTDSIAIVTYHGGKTEKKPTGEAKEADVDFPVNIDIPNPSGAKSMVITWAMLDADNDWWWAIDNVVVEGTLDGAAVEPGNKLSASWGAIKAAR
jgi:hypothetical protein